MINEAKALYIGRPLVPGLKPGAIHNHSSISNQYHIYVINQAFFLHTPQKILLLCD